MTSTYQAWLNKDREWIGAYCSRTRRSSLTKIAPLTLLLAALVLGGIGFLNGGGVSGLVMGIIGGLVFGLVICGIYLAILMPNLSPARYTRKLEQSVRELSMDETEQERLGTEMLAVLESGKGDNLLPDGRAQLQGDPGPGDLDAPLYPAGGQRALCRADPTERHRRDPAGLRAEARHHIRRQQQDPPLFYPLFHRLLPEGPL